MNTLNPGDVVNYTDLHGAKRRLVYVATVGFINAIKGLGSSLQDQFIDERGCIMHIPTNVWAFTGIKAQVNEKT